MTTATLSPIRPIVTIGVDTRGDIDVAVAPDPLGRRPDTLNISTPADGQESLERWSRDLGDVAGFGVEGTGGWGAGLVRHLRDRGHDIVEVAGPPAAPGASRARACARPRQVAQA